MADCRPYRGVSGVVRCEHTQDYWYAAALMVGCDYCGVPPFEPCRTLGRLEWQSGELVGGGRPLMPCRNSHTRRMHEGFALVAKALHAGGHGDRANSERPPDPPLSAEDVVAIVQSVLAAEPKPAPRRTTKKRAG